jgi:Reverse transcriptase (RNA-dependent DNA polymerase)
LLLECLGKLLEKLIAKLIYRDMAKHCLVPTTQFSGRNSSSTLDAGLSLVHDIQSAHHGGLRTGLLLFDIQGYFDHVNHERLVAIIADLGFAPELVNWCRSFLKDRTVQLKFNGQTSDPFDFAVGTPQGSPVSPVLSTIYTSPLLHHMRGQNKTSLSMYIDDGAIFACGRDWNEIEEAMRAGYTTCVEWLARAGLNVEPDKTELIFFKKRRERLEPPTQIHLPLPTHNTYYRVQATDTLRYLGFYFDTRLTWSHHVDIMCNRARVTIKSLQLLGNSVRGLDHAKWKLAYNIRKRSICLKMA